jgi:homoserine O-acetyltransferase
MPEPSPITEVSSEQSGVLRYMQRRIIMSDPHWGCGNYYKGKFPVVGMKHAR